MRRWIALKAGGNATTPEFIALAERLSRQDLDAFFDEWLFTAAKPASLPAVAATATANTASAASRALRAAARRGARPRR